MKLKFKASAHKAEVYFSPKGNGQNGDMVIIDSEQYAEEIAAILGVPAGWTHTRVGKGWAAFNPGDRLTLAQFKEDLGSEDDL
jgi:hypothetical protein